MTARVVPLLLLLAPACRTADGDAPVQPTDEPVDSDSDSPPDTDDTEVDGPTADTAPVRGTADTAPDGPRPPASLGDGWRDVTASLWATGAWDHYTPGPMENPDDMPATTGDLDGDGVPEVLLWRVSRADDPGPESGQVFSWDGTQRTLVWREALSHALQEQGPGAPYVVADLDGDGDDDLVRQLVSSGMLFLNDGGGTFTPAEVLGTDSAYGMPGLHAATLVDLDADGWLDVLTGPSDCDTGTGGVVPLVRTAPARWEAMPDLLAPAPRGDPYALGVLPWGDDIALQLVGRTCDEATSPHLGFWEPVASGADGRRRWALFDPTPSTAFWRLMPPTAGVTLTGVQPMGTLSADLDVDGAFELLVSPSHPHAAWFGPPAGGVFPDWSAARGPMWPVGGDGLPWLPWALAPVDLDADGTLDLVVTHGADASAWRAGVPHYPYHPTAWWNDGAADLHPLHAVSGLDRVLGDHRGLVVTDLDGDADPDLLVGGFDHLPAVLEARLDSPGHRLGVRLRGTTSNPLGIGAIVEVEADGLPMQRRWAAEMASPGAQGAPLVLAGLGAADTADVTVRWPSGVVQRVEDLAAGATHTLEEPALITLSEPSRHLPADGVSVLEVRVTPRLPDGTLDVAASVGIDVAWGAGAWEGPASWDGTAWVRRLVGPTSAGETVLSVDVDGATAGVRPRVWWE